MSKKVECRGIEPRDRGLGNLDGTSAPHKAFQYRHSGPCQSNLSTDKLTWVFSIGAALRWHWRRSHSIISSFRFLLMFGWLMAPNRDAIIKDRFKGLYKPIAKRWDHSVLCRHPKV